MAAVKAKIKNNQLMVKVKLSFKETLNVGQLDFFDEKYIRGLFKIKKVKKRTVEYFGPIGISLYDRLKKPISKYDFLFIMEQIVDVVQKLNSNTLIINHVLFDIKSVFMNETTRELQFLYLPLDSGKRNVGIIDFMEQIIYDVKPIQEADTNYVTRYIYFLKTLDKFDAEQIEKFILHEDASIVNIIKKHNIGSSGYMTDKPRDYYSHYEQKEEATGLLEENTGLLQEEQTGLLEEEATGLLNEEIQPICYAILFRCKTNELVKITKPVFRIGKESSSSDYIIVDNDKVSRSHANIIARKGQRFIVDLNSKNRTFVNNNVVPVQQEVEIFNGDRIMLANEEFELRI